MQRLNILYLLCGIAFLNVCLLGVVFLGFARSSNVVTFDKDVVVKQFVTQLSLQHLSEDKTEKLSVRFAKALKDAIDEYARKNKSTIIKKEMAFASHIDITSILARDIAYKMRAKL